MAGLCYFTTVAYLLLFLRHASYAEAGDVGLDYGLLGDNLPPPTKVVGLLQSRSITRVRLYDPNPDALQALQGSGIEVVLGTLNQDLPELAGNISFARSWVIAHVIPYARALRFRYIAAGNEVVPGDLASYVLPAMKNLDQVLKDAQLPYSVPVSTVFSMEVLGASYPPSQGAFSADLLPTMTSITSFLSTKGSPFLINVYPYFAYISNLKSISLDYAMFSSKEVVVRDGDLEYKNLFDSMVDAVHAALEKAGGASVKVVVTESGWPSKGNGDIATIDNARMYNNNLVKHVTGGAGTPKRTGQNLETYLFAIFNEDLKPAGTEQNFGLYYPNMQEVYHVDFNNKNNDRSDSRPSSDLKILSSLGNYGYVMLTIFIILCHFLF